MREAQIGDGHRKLALGAQFQEAAQVFRRDAGHFRGGRHRPAGRDADHAAPLADARRLQLRGQPLSRAFGIGEHRLRAQRQRERVQHTARVFIAAHMIHDRAPGFDRHRQRRTDLETLLQFREVEFHSASFCIAKLCRTALPSAQPSGARLRR